MPSEWTEDEITLVKKSYENCEPIRLICARLNYAHNKNQILELARRKKFTHKNNYKKQFCQFCFAELTKEDKECVTYTFYNSNYCKKCNILLEKTQDQAITETLINMKKNTIKTKLECNNMQPTRICTSCKQEKSIEEYSWEISGKRVQAQCKECRRSKQTKNNLKEISNMQRKRS